MLHGSSLPFPCAERVPIILGGMFMRVECPNCGAKGQIDESKRPPGVNSIRCPKCGAGIPLQAVAAAPEPERPGEIPSSLPPPPSGAAIPPPAAPRMPKPSNPLTVEPVAATICSVCNRPFPREDMVRFGPSLVCAGCKPMYVQMLEQGAAKPGSFRYGGFWIRFVAKFIDGLILGAVNLAISFLIAIPFGKSGDPSTAVVAGGLSMVANLAFAVGMTTWFLGRYGATPGKMAFGLVVVHPDGRSISYGRACGRYFAEILSSLSFTIGYIIAAFDDEKRALHDRICDTRVVYK